MIRKGIGFCGAHRTGKTTQAKILAVDFDIPFVQTSVSGVFKKLGLDPAMSYDLNTRLSVQEATLIDSIDRWEEQGNKWFVTDRTPFDFIAYTLANIRQEELTPENDDLVKKYINRCFVAASTYFNCFVEFQPGIKVIEADGKANTCDTFISHIAYIIHGLCSDREDTFVMPKKVTSISERSILLNDYFRGVSNVNR